VNSKHSWSASGRTSPSAPPSSPRPSPRSAPAPTSPCSRPPASDIQKPAQSDGEEAATRALQHETARLSRAFRALETCGKPVAAAINGTALGGGFELCLACHYRVVAEDPDIKLGLPESRVGLLPGAGGTQRLPRLIGAKEALPLMLRGRHIDPAEALKLGAVHKLVPPERLLDEAKDWVLNHANRPSRGTRKPSACPAAPSIRPKGSSSGRRPTRSTARRPSTTTTPSAPS
jgi:enoyl-CoA hydratase/carnithine racemase